LSSSDNGCLRTIVVDDEALARRRLKTMLRQIEWIELVGEAADGDAALRLIREEEPDVVLLDIKMPGRDGFDLLGMLGEIPAPVIVFVTAFNHFAVQAFESEAVDYLLKPVSFARLQASLERTRKVLRNRDVEERLREVESILEVLRTSAEPPVRPRFEREFWVQRRAEHLRVPVEDVEWIEAERDYVRIHAKGEAYLMRDTIRSLAERLDPECFVRVHRSAIVRRDLVAAVRHAAYGALRISLANGAEVPVGRTYTRAIKRELLLRRDTAEEARTS